MARRKAPRIPDALLDQLLAGADPKTAFDADGLLDDLKKALAERALNAEMDRHLAGDVGADADTALLEKISVTPANVNDGKAGHRHRLQPQAQTHHPARGERITNEKSQASLVAQR